MAGLGLNEDGAACLIVLVVCTCLASSHERRVEACREVQDYIREFCECSCVRERTQGQLILHRCV